MSRETLLRAIDFTFSMPMKRLEFGFFGGEPLLEWELLKFATLRIEDIATQKDIELVKTVTSNAILLNEEKSRWLREHAFYMVISIDGDRKMHDRHRVYADGSSTFRDVEESILTLQKYYNKGEYCTNSVITPQNIEHLNDSVAYLFEDLKIDKINLAIDYSAKWGEDTRSYTKIFYRLREYIIEQYRENRDISIDILDEKIRSAIEESCSVCGFAEQKIGIAPSGTIYPCERLIGDDTGVLSIGDVFDGIDPAKRADLIANRGNVDPECQACPLKSRCLNSCGCTNYTLTGSINTTDGVVCFFQKLLIEVADQIASTLYQERNRLFIEKFYNYKIAIGVET